MFSDSAFAEMLYISLADNVAFTKINVLFNQKSKEINIIRSEVDGKELQKVTMVLIERYQQHLFLLVFIFILIQKLDLYHKNKKLEIPLFGLHYF